MRFEGLCPFLRFVLAAGALLLAVANASAQTTEATPSTGPLSGYMDFHVNKPDKEPATIDFHRFVLLLSHSFSPRIRFVGELELEHAFVEGLEEAGELELEQAYVDFLLTRRVNIRAGMVLVPLGIINERHEPPVYNGVERPFVDTVIIPTTWFDVGVGVHGALGSGFRYRGYALAPLNAFEFTADEGIRGGRQKGSQAEARSAAFAGRLEYLGVRGLAVGASAWTGGATPEGSLFDSTVTIGEFDARYRRGRTELRAQFAQVAIGNAGALNESLGRATGVSPNIAKSLRGAYVEAAYRLWNSGSPRDLVGFVRYENFDTQHRMPDGFVPLKEFDRDAWVIGAAYFPDPDVAVKFDYVQLRNQGALVPTRHTLNAGLGWWF